VPQDSEVQTIADLSFSALPAPVALADEPKYGNRIACWTIESPTAPLAVTMRFTCIRREARLDLARLGEDGAVDPADAYRVFLDPDRLVTVDDTVRGIAREVVGAQAGAATLARARAIYDHVVRTMVYDKNHDGWGQGSTQHACDVHKGNCTDFHALFNSLCRAESIACGFEIGLFLPYEPVAAGAPAPTLGGYHCWALFRVPGRTWVPVDCSEAFNHPDRGEYFFGSHTCNRVALSTGRDLVLAPAQAGAPLNYFLNPYAEADDAPVAATKRWTFTDL
jgi:transglutaminase-like putative cysteine protease